MFWRPVNSGKKPVPSCMRRMHTPLDQTLTFGRCDRPGNNAEQSTFAGTVPAHDSNAFPAIHAEVYLPKRREGAVVILPPEEESVNAQSVQHLIDRVPIEPIHLAHVTEMNYGIRHGQPTPS